MRQPLVWGIVVCANFFALLYQGAFNSPWLPRYCAGHPIEIIELTVFFIGLAALAAAILRCRWAVPVAAIARFCRRSRPAASRSPIAITC